MKGKFVRRKIGPELGLEFWDLPGSSLSRGMVRKVDCEIFWGWRLVGAPEADIFGEIIFWWEYILGSLNNEVRVDMFNMVVLGYTDFGENLGSC